MKIEIRTQEEYEMAQKRFEEIKEERDQLKNLVNTDNYRAHVPLGLNFEELIINLQRDNSNIDRYLNEVINNFLKTQDISKEHKKNLKSIFIEQSNKLGEISIDKLPEISGELEEISEYFPDFKMLYDTILESSKRKQTNDYLINYMNDLNMEADELSIKLHKYEKEQRKKGGVSTFRSIFSSKSKSSNSSKKSRR